jgi:eukaryotic-like serine/threonine-protein kinase
MPSEDQQRAVTVPAEGEEFAITLESPIATQPRYEMMGVIGEGGMGTVLLARDRVIGRDVAMKVMRPEQSQRGDLRRRFRREALVQGQLEHPAVVPVYDLGLTPDGSPCFTMKRVRGVTLEQIIDAMRRGDADAERARTRHELLNAFGRVCLAIEFSHARGVLHRDLKPANVMLGDFGEVYVLDWGVAKLRGEAQEALAATNVGAATAETLLGAVMGTPGYLAPERLTPDCPVGARADVYSLGAVLFEILSLQPLHVAGVTGKSLDASTRAGTDARPSMRAPERHVPPELDAICVKATALSPSDRYESCRELHAALERFLEGDRDLERRREMSAEHAHRAHQAVAAQTGAPSARSEAILELGRALSLDPSNVQAADLLVKLLTAPPSELPEGARAAVIAEERGLEHVRARTGALGFFAWIVVVPIGLWAGLRSPAALAAMCVAFLVVSAALYFASRRPSPDGTSSPYLVLLGAFAVATTFTMFGPFIALPGLAGVSAMGFSIGQRPRLRWLPLALCSLSLLVPLALEFSGAIPPSYVFEGGMMCVVPRAVAFARVPSYVFLAVVNLVLIGVAANFGVTLGAALRKAHRRMHLQSWQLRQLVPSEAGTGDYPAVGSQARWRVPPSTPSLSSDR